MRKASNTKGGASNQSGPPLLSLNLEVVQALSQETAAQFLPIVKHSLRSFASCKNIADVLDLTMDEIVQRVRLAMTVRDLEKVVDGSR